MTARLVLTLLLGAAALMVPFATASLADDSGADGPPDQTNPALTSDPNSGASPEFACGVGSGTIHTGGPTRATFTCWVRGAPASDTTFSVEVVRRSEAVGDSRTLGAANSTLQDGTGMITLDVADAGGFFLAGGVSVAGSLQPSGVPLGPVLVNPTLAASSS